MMHLAHWPSRRAAPPPLSPVPLHRRPNQLCFTSDAKRSTQLPVRTGTLLRCLDMPGYQCSLHPLRPPPAALCAHRRRRQAVSPCSRPKPAQAAAVRPPSSMRSSKWNTPWPLPTRLSCGAGRAGRGGGCMSGRRGAGRQAGTAQVVATAAPASATLCTTHPMRAGKHAVRQQGRYCRAPPHSLRRCTRISCWTRCSPRTHSRPAP